VSGAPTCACIRYTAHWRALAADSVDGGGGAQGRIPSTGDPNVSRDFVYIDDTCEAFVDAALNLTPECYGESFNIGTGKSTSIGELAEAARELYKVESPPQFSTMPSGSGIRPAAGVQTHTRQGSTWMERAHHDSGRTAAHDGLVSVPGDKALYDKHAKGYQSNPNESISAIVACYKDAKAIPIMYQRLVQVFEKLHIDYEIIFVNDGSPDKSQEVIQEISSRNYRVLGITHSRNFGSQAAFRSGLEISSKRACVLLDGDLQDPPELIEQFVEKWRRATTWFTAAA